MTEQELQNHSVFQMVNQLENRLSQDDAQQIKREDRDYVFAVIQHFKSRMSAINLILLNTDSLKNISTHFKNALNEINNYLSNKNYGHVNNSKSHLNNVTNLTNQLPFIIKTKENLTQIISSFKNIIDTDTKEIEARLDELNKKNSQLNNLLQKVEKTIAEQQNQANQYLANYQNEFNKLKDTLSTQSVEEKKKAVESSGKIIEDLEAKYDEARKIVNIIGNVGVTGDYQKQAEAHKGQANIWRWIAVFFMLVAVVYLGITVFGITKYEWHVSLLRILATAILIYPAQYAANESVKHRKISLYNRKMELDLAAINPFIELFEEKEKLEIKKAFVDRYFNNQPLYEEKEKDEIPLSVYERIAASVADIYSKIKK